MDQEEIRRTAIIAMFSDDVLMERLVLKGGNALDLVHGLSARGSIDVDFSIEGDFEDLDDISSRILRALRDRFDSAGMRVFDEKFEPKPSKIQVGQDARWGGYLVLFKLIDKSLAGRLGSLDAMQRNADVVGYAQEKIFRIEISKFEYCVGKVEREFDSYTIYVYPPEMIAAEKLRAVCQQMESYEPGRNKRPRARDFYDLHTVVTRASVDLTSPQNNDLIRAVFAAKNVPLKLIGEIPSTREFHRPDWPSVEQALRETAMEFDAYFDFVVGEVWRLEPLWNK